MATTIGKRLKTIRKKKQLSIDEVADKLGFGYDQLVKIEADQRSVSDDEILAFANLYQVKLQYLKEGNVFIDHTDDILDAFKKLDLEEQHDFIALFSTIRKPQNKS